MCHQDTQVFYKNDRYIDLGHLVGKHTHSQVQMTLQDKLLVEDRQL